jgi:hypothetical protein
MTNFGKYRRFLFCVGPVAVGAAVAAAPQEAAAAVITVNAAAPGPGCSFSEAVEALNAQTSNGCTPGNGVNDTILMPARVSAYTSSNNVAILRSVTIVGAAPSNTVLQFSGGAREGETALHGCPAAGMCPAEGIVVTIRNLTLRGTDGNQLGGLFVERGTFTLSNVRFTNFGFAGVRNGNEGSISIEGSRIDHNGIFGELPLGGGLANFGTMTVTSSSITDNFAAEGGGIANFGQLAVTRSSITNNEALFAGGGVLIGIGGFGALLESTLTDNLAEDGGGVAVVGSGGADARIDLDQSLIANNFAEGRGGGLFSTGQVDPFAVNNTFSGNQAAFGGGLWHQSGGELDMVHCTFAFNTATQAGGGVHVANAGQSNFSFNLIGNNWAPASPDILAVSVLPLGDYNLIESATGVEASFPDEANGGHNLFGLDPLIGGLQNLGGPTAVHPLLNGSGAIDRIPPTVLGTSSTDQRNFPRPQDGNDGASRTGFDIGAYEQGPNEPLMGFELQGTWTSSAPLTLTATQKTQGLFGLNVGGSGYRVLTSAPLKTPLLPLGSTLSLDFFLPSGQPNPWWFGAVQAYASCPSAGLSNVYLGQVELTGKPVNAFSTLAFAVPATILTALSQMRTDCFFTVAVNTNPTAVAPVLDNLR